MHSAISTTMPPPVPGAALEGDELDRLLAYWNAANYLTVAQIYLSANPLLREPLRAHQAAPARLLGHLPRAEPRLRAAQPPDPQNRSGGAVHRRSQPRRPRGRGKRLHRGLLALVVVDLLPDAWRRGAHPRVVSGTALGAGLMLALGAVLGV